MASACFTITITACADPCFDDGLAQGGCPTAETDSQSGPNTNTMTMTASMTGPTATETIGTMSMIGITELQDSYWFVLTQPIGFLIFMMAALAEMTRPPFDMPIADSEIIFGAYTEYTGLKFAFFLLSEYGAIVVFSAIASVLFLGGYRALPGLGAIPPPLWMAGKIAVLSFVIIWLRATFPRLREDQLQRFAWLALIPLALLQIMVVAVLKVAY